MAWFRKRDRVHDEFMELVFVHADGLYRYARRLTSDAGEAEDLVQEALTKALDAFGRLRRDTNHRAWVFTILRNTYISRKRRAWREEELPEPDELPTAVREDSPAAVFRNDFEDEVLEALDQLPELQRTAIVLCDVEGMSYGEIAQVMDCPVGTVRSRIHHGRRSLRALLDQYGKSRGYGRVDKAL